MSKNYDDEKLLYQFVAENHELLSRILDKCGSGEALGLLLRQHVEASKRQPGSLTVPSVAEFLGVSSRRVRALLTQGRIDGFKDDQGNWFVKSPLHVKPSHRGPDLQGYPARKLQPPKLKIIKSRQS